MATSNAIEKEKQSLSIGRIIIIVIMVFTIIPATILGIMYFSNENFRYIANNHFSTSPGFIGSYFQSFPTREERDLQKRQVSSYLLSMDSARAADKLTIIKKEDESLYNDILKMMTRSNAQQTGKITDILRENGLKKDILTSTIEQMETEKRNTYIDKAKFYETLSMGNLLNEINNGLMNEFVSFREMGLILEQMKEDTVVRVLKLLDEDMAAKIMSNFESAEKKNKIQQSLYQLKDKESSLVSLAHIYNGDKPQSLVQELGNEKKYKLEELSLIFRNLSVLQGAKVFNLIEDQQFQSKLLTKIKEDEILATGNLERTEDLMLAMRSLRVYEERVAELVKVYSKMEPQQIADMVGKLYKSNGTIVRETFSNKESIVITERNLTLDLLRSLKEKTQAEVLVLLDGNLGSEISKELATRQ